MENQKKALSPFRAGNLVKKDRTAIVAWPGDLCIPENLAQIKPLKIDDLVLKHLGFKADDHSSFGNQTYLRKINWPETIEEERKFLKFFVSFTDDRILIGLKHPTDSGPPLDLLEVQFAHDLQNHYALITGVDELNVLSVNGR